MSKVFVVQKTMRWDSGAGELRPKFDLGPAEKYGELVYLLSPTAAPFNAQTVLPELHEKLRTITPDDYLLLLGNPALIGIVSAIAADYNDGNLRMLQWSGKERDYIPLEIEGLFDPHA